MADPGAAAAASSGAGGRSSLLNVAAAGSDEGAAAVAQAALELAKRRGVKVAARRGTMSLRLNVSNGSLMSAQLTPTARASRVSRTSFGSAALSPAPVTTVAEKVELSQPQLRAAQKLADV